MILTHESGSQEDQFDEKKWRQKISWDYPFKVEKSREILLWKAEQSTGIFRSYGTVYLVCLGKQMCETCTWELLLHIVRQITPRALEIRIFFYTHFNA
jgi:hypothetical protein